MRGSARCWSINFYDGCDLTSIYSVCAIQDISECMSLDKETRQRKRLWRGLDDKASADESLGESSISIKDQIRYENTELLLELTSNLAICVERLPFGRRCADLLKKCFRS